MQPRRPIKNTLKDTVEILSNPSDTAKWHLVSYVLIIKILMLRLKIMLKITN